MLTAGMLNWAEYDMARRRVPVADIVDYWTETDAYQIGVAKPVRGAVFRYGQSDLWNNRFELTMNELCDPVVAANKLAKYSLFERMSRKAHQVG